MNPRTTRVYCTRGKRVVWCVALSLAASLAGLTCRRSIWCDKSVSKTSASWAYRNGKGGDTLLRARSKPYYAFLGSNSSFGGYINEEFHKHIAELSTTYAWAAISPKEIAAAASPAAAEAAAVARGHSHGPASWADLERHAVATYGSAPSAMLFVLKFHRNFFALARLGLRSAAAGAMRSTRMLVFVDDLHWFDRDSARIQQQALASADLLLATYAYDVALLYSGAPRPLPVPRQTQRQQLIAWLPHAATPEFFVPVRAYDQATKRVLLSGATAKEWYPYRHLVRQQWIKGDNGSERVSVLAHPGYEASSSSASPSPVGATRSRLVGRPFAVELNKHVACLTDGLHLDYVIAKIFEIPAAGCLLLVNAELSAPLARLGFFKGVHFLSYKDPRELGLLVNWVLGTRNQAATARIERRAQQMVYQMHHVAHRAAALDALASRC